MYARLPTVKEQLSCENSLGPRGSARRFKSLGRWSKSHEVLLLLDPKQAIQASHPRPLFFANHKHLAGSPWHRSSNPKVHTVPAGSGVAYVKSFRAMGRVWLLTPDLLLVPADRVYPYKPSPFQGIALGGDQQLPLAWIRGDDAKQYRLKNKGFEPQSSRWHRLSHVLLRGNKKRHRGHWYWQTKKGDAWLRQDKHSSVVEALKKLRWLKPSDRWIWASVMGGTMVAYDGLRPVYTTLWSGGKGGLPVPGGDARKLHTTELGVFPLQWKDKVATMSPDKGAPSVFWFPAVPHIQYVKAPLAMHVSYWHDRFGNLMSAECLNLSPRDGKWFFDFSSPKVPAGWNSVRPHRLTGKATRIRIVP